MGVRSATEKAIRLLLPKGSAWTLGGSGASLIRGISEYLETAREDTDSIVSESKPGTAEALLAEWYDTLGIKYDSTLPISILRARLETYRYTLGGARLEDLQRAVSAEFPDITISEVCASSICGEDECGVSITGAEHADTSALYYDVIGTVDTEEEAQRIGYILQHLSQAHLIPMSDITVRELTTSSECGVGICGVELTGSDGTD